jgi:hypothetical protein
MSLSAISETLANIGAPGALIVFGLYILLRGEFVFRYPARRRKGTTRASRHKPSP